MSLPIRATVVAALFGLSLAPARAPHAQAMIYPNAGQTQEQMGQDRTACETQASAQSGYHPSQPAAAPAPMRPMAGQRLAGAARGAARGALREQTTDKSDREFDDVVGAGARFGAAAGGVRQRQDRRAYRAEAQQQQAGQSQKQAAFTQGFSTCMASRGYTVQ